MHLKSVVLYSIFDTLILIIFPLTNMNLLSTTKSAMTWLCIYPANKSENGWKKIAHKFVGGTLFVISCVGVAAHLAFIWKFWRTDLEGSLFAFMSFIANCGTVYTKLIAFPLQHRMYSIFEKLSEIYDASKHRFRN